MSRRSIARAEREIVEWRTSNAHGEYAVYTPVHKFPRSGPRMYNEGHTVTLSCRPRKQRRQRRALTAAGYK